MAIVSLEGVVGKADLMVVAYVFQYSYFQAFEVWVVFRGFLLSRRDLILDTVPGEVEEHSPALQLNASWA